MDVETLAALLDVAMLAISDLQNRVAELERKTADE